MADTTSDRLNTIALILSVASVVFTVLAVSRKEEETQWISAKR